MAYTLPELPYAYDALEPFIDKETMTIHHSKHHQAYINKLNTTLEGYPDFQDKTVGELIANLESVPKKIHTAVRNHGGGHFNHSLFWTILKKESSFSGDIAVEIKSQFGSYEQFKEKFSAVAAGIFGSGWAWLVINREGKLDIQGTSNQDSPLSTGGKPLICLDVWEHAYYLKYQNHRPDYIDAFFNLINWEKVDELFLDAK